MKHRNGRVDNFYIAIGLKPLVREGLRKLMAWDRWWERVWED